MMKKSTMLIIVSVIAIFLIIGAGVAIAQSNKDDETHNSDETMMNEEDEDTMMKDEEEVMDEEDDTMIDEEESKSGSYIEYSKSALTSDTNVIFFAASWCPTCRSLDSNITSNLDSIPSGVTILKADYDNEKDLKKQYGVTYQHTLVQVDQNGNQIKKWNGSPDIESIVEEII